MIAEVGGCGLLEESAVQTHLDGLANALRHLGMLQGGVGAAACRHAQRRPLRLAAHARRRAGGRRRVRAGDEVRAGECLGVVRDLFGDVVEEIAAPEDGVVLFLTTSPAVQADGLLLGLGADIDAL